MMMRIVFVVMATLFAAIAPAYAQSAVIRGLDKVTGHARDYTLPLGRPTRVGTLEVVARACSKNPPEERPEVRIFVDVTDHPPAAAGQESEPVDLFHGWLFASSPGLSAVEHPVYDIWAIDCR